MLDEDEKILREELEQFKQEKKKIKKILGSYGGKQSTKTDKIVNYIIAAVVLFLFVLSSLRFFGIDTLFPSVFYVEIGIAIISFKIIWMIHKNAKVYHFQFWMLQSIEFRLTKLSNKINDVEERLEEIAPEEK